MEMGAAGLAGVLLFASVAKVCMGIVSTTVAPADGSLESQLRNYGSLNRWSRS